MIRKERVLVTGGTGSLGHALVARLIKQDVFVRVFARDEKKQYEMAKLFPSVQYVLGDVRDPAACRDAVRDVDVVIHGASLKYVNISELQPREYITTNVMGTVNMVDAVLAAESVRRFVGISTDKACLPINTYGMTKALLEKVILEAQTRQGKYGQTSFTVARYGNVVGTRGSVVPFWQERRIGGLTLPVTNPDMTRFFFTLDEAVALVEYALQADPGLIVSKRMSACTVGDLANAMRGDSEVEILGERPGEKHHELLLTEEEMSRTSQDGDIFLYDPSRQPSADSVDYFGSDNAPRLSQDELKVMLAEYL